MKAFYLIVGQMFFSERNRLAEIIVVYIVPVDEIIVVIDDAEPAYYLSFYTKLLLQFTEKGGIEILAGFDSAARGFYQSGLAEVVIAVDTHKIKETEIIINNRSGYLTVMVDIFKGPLVVIKMDRELLSVHYALFP